MLFLHEIITEHDEIAHKKGLTSLIHLHIFFIVGTVTISINPLFVSKWLERVSKDLLHY